MPVRDARSTLDACIDSIRAQTLTDWELVAVDDDSTDGSSERLAWHASLDARIRVHRSPGRGIVAALNAGLDRAAGPLVARMDADDLMLPDRLADQRRCLEADHRLTLVGCPVEPFPRGRVGKGMRAYLDWQNRCRESRVIRDEIYVESPFTHPSVMFRTERIRAVGGYRDGDFPEDYELWLRLARDGHRMGKTARTGLRWRQGEATLSRRDPRYSREAFDRLRACFLARDPRLSHGRALVYWGAGRRTRARARHLVDRGHPPAAWVDVDPRKIGNRIGGVEVVAPEWLEDRRDAAGAPFVLGYVASHGARDAMAARLRSFGYRRGEDYLMVG